MNKQIYAIIVSEDGMDSYILNGCSTNLDRVKEIMGHRAEELVDELVARDVELSAEPGDYSIVAVEDGMSVNVTRGDGLDPTNPDSKPAIVATMEIQSTELVD